MNRFVGKTTLVTGSGRGIGREIALHFAREGSNIIVNFFRNRQPAEETASEIRNLGRRCLVIKANVGDLEDLERLYVAIEEEFGSLDFLIHNAASGYNRPAMEQRPRGWEWTLNINARSFLFGAQHAVPLMTRNGGGAIVALSSLGSTRVMEEYVVVGASKAALEALVRYLGVELAPRNIRVNAIAPGMVLTDALEHFATFREEGQSLENTIRAATPAGRLCTPEDVAELTAFLCSPGAAMLCGQTITLDGGYSLRATSSTMHERSTIEH